MKDPKSLKKRGLQDVELLAKSLNLDLKRTKRMLQLARKMIPLPADLEDLDIVYEVRWKNQSWKRKRRVLAPCLLIGKQVCLLSVFFLNK